MSRRERLVLMVIGPLGILLVFYYLVYSPKQAEYSRLRAELDDRRMQLERMETTARQLTRLREEYTRLQAFIAEVEAKLPAEKELPSLLVQLERLTRSLGVSHSRRPHPRPEQERRRPPAEHRRPPVPCRPRAEDRPRAARQLPQHRRPLPTSGTRLGFRLLGHSRRSSGWRPN
ncbi:MAG: hypothetical protein E6H05_14195 [Bacillati bacterium ANGP1]|uniref:Uncharacterized protein n=1 Tax=Candidatus Segetimicrobium genomatis TaxID=2569760 RepID=A0A537IFJ9_9BACT|nr:MAG: hypothetical protein E6H05_14195 [Terrabacteria group bacterium ANGP1]